jgi:hypothetical protein
MGKRRNKPTAADRPQFRRDVAKMMVDLGVGVGEPDDAVILCTRADDFDPASNVLWENEANKSAVRPDVRCSTCKHNVALSNHAYARYCALDKKPRICCTACLPTLLKDNP